MEVGVEKGGVRLLIERFMAVRSSHSPRVHGGCVYYISDVTGQGQAWRACPGREGLVHDMLFPWPRRIGSLAPGRWGLAFSSDFDGDERWAIYVYRGDGIVRVAGGDGSVNVLGDWGPGGLLAYTGTARSGVDFDLYVYDPARGEDRLAARLEGMNRPGPWVDERRLLVVHANSNLDTDIYLVDVESGEAVNLTRHEGEALNESPSMLTPSSFAFATSIGSEYVNLAVYDLERREYRVVASHGWDVEQAAAGGGVIYYTVNEDGESVLYSLRPGGEPVRIAGLRGVAGGLVYEEGVVALHASRPEEGVEVYLLSRGLPRRLTRSPKMGLGDADFTYPERFSFTASDGVEIRGLIYRPREPLGDPPPAVIWLHGGPESQERPRFNPIIQALARLGVAVAAPNYRGSTGYGKTFTHLDDVDKRLDAVRDVYEAVQHLASRRLIDPGRLCVMGGSYGGYLTLMSLALYPDAWRCGVEIVGIFNLVTFIRNTSPYRRRYRIPEYGDPDVHGEVMLRLSPVSYADRIKAPLVVVHGARDPRVPVSEAEQLVETLRGRGVEVRYIRLEDEGHGIAKIENRIRVYTEALEFILSHLAPRGGESRLGR